MCNMTNNPRIRTSSRAVVGALFLLGAVSACDAAANTDDCASKKNLFVQLSCYAAAAKATNDLAACDQALHEGIRYQCYAIFAEYSGSPEVCHKIPPRTDEHRSLIDACLSDVATKILSPSLCEEIATPGLRDSCYLKLAKKTGAPALCARIGDPGLKSACNGEPVIIK
jgi:hypothetical protein